MMCYRDITFCGFSECKKFKDCRVALTGEVKSRAEKAGMLIAQYADKPECFMGEKLEVPK